MARCKWCDRVGTMGRDHGGDPVCDNCFDEMEKRAPDGSWNRAIAKAERKAREHVVNTFAELEEWLDDIGRTAQITYRVKLTPKFLVRIVKQDRHDRATTNYVQATGDTIEEAIERCLEAYMTDGFSEHDGHLGGGE